MNGTGNQQDISAEAVPPVQYQIVTKDGKIIGPYPTAERAGWWAKSFFPAEEQDPDRTGAGWDVEVVR